MTWIKYAHDTIFWLLLTAAYEVNLFTLSTPKVFPSSYPHPIPHKRYLSLNGFGNHRIFQLYQIRRSCIIFLKWSSKMCVNLYVYVCAHVRLCVYVSFKFKMWNWMITSDPSYGNSRCILTFVSLLWRFFIFLLRCFLSVKARQVTYTLIRTRKIWHFLKTLKQFS